MFKKEMAAWWHGFALFSPQMVQCQVKLWKHELEISSHSSAKIIWLLWVSPTPPNTWCKYKHIHGETILGHIICFCDFWEEKKKWILFMINACPSLLKSVWCIFKDILCNLSQNFKRGILFIACQPGFYKASDGNMKCAKCPPHSSTHEEGSVNCRCENNYFRADKDPPSMACTRE